MASSWLRTALLLLNACSLAQAVALTEVQQLRKDLKTCNGKAKKLEAALAIEQAKVAELSVNGTGLTMNAVVEGVQYVANEAYTMTTVLGGRTLWWINKTYASGLEALKPPSMSQIKSDRAAAEAAEGWDRQAGRARALWNDARVALGVALDQATVSYNAHVAPQVATVWKEAEVFGTSITAQVSRLIDQTLRAIESNDTARLYKDLGVDMATKTVTRIEEALRIKLVHGKESAPGVFMLLVLAALMLLYVLRSLLVSKKPNRSKAAHTPAIVACAPPTTPSPPEHPIASGVPSADTYQPVQSSEPPVHSPPIPAPSQEKHYASPPANQHALGFGSQSPRKVMPTSIPTHPTPPQYHRGSKATSVTSEVLSITSYASTSKSKSQKYGAYLAKPSAKSPSAVTKTPSPHRVGYSSKNPATRIYRSNEPAKTYSSLSSKSSPYNSALKTSPKPTALSAKPRDMK
mmetsp:Transcript_31079/g.59975  ORF Transcript_31079/g.59975 Transcript_31079/m.59975 type:complete len:462 (+) Transcript_31079:66-1451(+)